MGASVVSNNDTPADAITVIQADRDAAADLLHELLAPYDGISHLVEAVRKDGSPVATALAKHRTTSLAAQDGLVDENERLKKLVQTYRGAQLRAEEKLCREQANAQGWKRRAELLEAKLAALASIEVKS